MKSDDIVPFLAAQPPDDLGFRQGQLIAWDPATEANTVLIAGQSFVDLPVLAVGTIAMAPGDLVGVLRYKSTYLILGRIAPAGSGALQTRSAKIPTTGQRASTSFGDLSASTEGDPGVGPSVAAYVGNSRQALVMLSASIAAPANDYAQMNVSVSGASSIPVDPINIAFLGAGQSDTQGTPAAMILFTAADGLSAGLNTFKAVYASQNGGTCFFRNRNLIVIPF